MIPAGLQPRAAIGSLHRAESGVRFMARIPLGRLVRSRLARDGAYTSSPVYLHPVPVHQQPAQVGGYQLVPQAQAQVGAIQHEVGLSPGTENKIKDILESFRGRITALLVMIVIGALLGYSISRLVALAEKSEKRSRAKQRKAVA